GGAGVLSDLIDADSDALSKVAKEALNLMHFENVDEAVETGDAGLLKDQGDGICVNGCYRCLLSYFNQTDHEQINRHNEGAKQLLINIVKGKVLPVASAVRSDLGDEWSQAFESSGLPHPDASSASFGGQEMLFVWKAHCAAASASALSEAAQKDAANKGWTLFELSDRSQIEVLKEIAAFIKG
ncbi:MAG: hypothetical protein K8963_09540, partial [Proteobacteria bacterium]|nr:hypothetical protein [Pseudomonadota bacterium]